MISSIDQSEIWESSKFHEPRKLLAGAVLRLRVPATEGQFMEWKFDKIRKCVSEFSVIHAFLTGLNAQMRFSHLEMRLFNLISHWMTLIKYFIAFIHSAHEF